MSDDNEKFNSTSPFSYHGHIKGLILRDGLTGNRVLFAFNTSTGPWASLDGRNNIPYLKALGCKELITLDSSYRDYAFDGQVEAIILHDLTVDDAVVIRLNRPAPYCESAVPGFNHHIIDSD